MNAQRKKKCLFTQEAFQKLRKGGSTLPKTYHITCSYKYLQNKYQFPLSKSSVSLFCLPQFLRIIFKNYNDGKVTKMNKNRI